MSGLRRLRLGMLGGLLAGGCVFQLGTCARSFAQVNPCGTILSVAVCDPIVYEQVFGDFWDVDGFPDPTCIVPGECDADENP